MKLPHNSLRRTAENDKTISWLTHDDMMTTPTLVSGGPPDAHCLVTGCHYIMSSSGHSVSLLSLQGCPWCPLTESRPRCQCQPLARPALGSSGQAWGKPSSPRAAGARAEGGHSLGLASSHCLLPTSLHSLIFYTRHHLLTLKPQAPIMTFYF